MMAKRRRELAKPGSYFACDPWIVEGRLHLEPLSVGRGLSDRRYVTRYAR